MSDVVGTSLNIEPLGNVDDSKTSCNAQEQEVNNLSEFLKLEHSKYIQYKVIYDVLEECVNEDSDLDENLKTKVKDIVLSGSVAQAIILDDNKLDQSGTSVFGVHGINNLELNYSERNQLEEVLKVKLEEKYKHVSKDYTKLTIERKAYMPPLQMFLDDKILIDYKNKLTFEQEQYVKNLLELLDILKEITSLRLKTLPLITDKKIQECKVEERINYLKSLLTQEKVRVDVFMETSNSLKAYKELIKDIKTQQHDYQKDIEELNKLKDKYEQVSCKQYDDILKSYLQYKSSVEKKKLLYDCLKS